MKKINLFNRNTNSPRGCREQSPLSMGKGCPVERGGVWACWRNAPRITPSPFGATPSWKEGERSGRGGLWFAALVALFVATPSFAEPTELDKKTVASKAYVDTKQDIIETGRVLFDENNGVYNYVPALVSYGTGTNGTDGILGNKIGVLDWNTYNVSFVGDLSNLDDDATFDAGDLDNYVPTVRFLVKEFHRLVWDNSSSKKSAKAINAYNTTFGNGTNNWVGNSGDLVKGQFLADSLALKQNKIAKSGYYYNTSGTVTAYGNSSSTNGWLNAGVKGTGLVTKTASNGVVGERKIFESADVANYHADGLTQIQQDIQDVSIPTVGAMMTAIANGANAALPTGTAGTVVTYNGVNAETGVQEFTETAISGTATYDDNDQLTNGNNIANVSLVETEIATRQKKRTCAGYEPGHENEADYCWLWNFPD